MKMEFTDIVESYTASLVREYLHRKGLKTTLNALDQEFPRGPLSINSTSSLIRELKMENVIKKNKCSKRPYRSILEVIVHHVKMNRKLTAKKRSGLQNHNPPTLLTLSHLKSIHNLLNENGHGLDFLTLIKLNCGCLPLSPKRFSCLKRTKYNIIKNPHSSSVQQFSLI